MGSEPDTRLADGAHMSAPGRRNGNQAFVLLALTIRVCVCLRLALP
jgi:hypothetical protein